MPNRFIERVQARVKSHCEPGEFGLERGAEKENPHLHGVVRMMPLSAKSANAMFNNALVWNVQRPTPGAYVQCNTLKGAPPRGSH